MLKTAKAPYRIAAILFLLFAAGHTAGFLTFHPKAADALAVQQEMSRVHFDFGGGAATWNDFYTGFGLFVSAYLLFASVLAWRLAGARETETAMARTLAWMLFAVQLATIALCLRYFGPVQAIFAVACAVTVGWAALQTKTTSPERSQSH
jgi:hypothetical protein